MSTAVPAPGDDHVVLPSQEAARRYFATFAGIISHVREVAALAETRAPSEFGKLQLDLIETYLNRLAETFTALSLKHLMSGRAGSPPMTLEIDRRDSGFPVYREVLTMATDLTQVDRHLRTLPDKAQLKEKMIAHILGERTVPAQLQYAMSQRIYYETLKTRKLFFAQNHPRILSLPTPPGERPRLLIHWAVYDSAQSLPVIYFLGAEDSGRTPLAEDPTRAPSVQSYLLAQSLSSLKLLTIARGFDADFDDLHPKLLRRIHVGPMYAHTFTEQSGPLREVLAETAASPRRDWALSWTIETLTSARHEVQPKGLFSSVQREIFALSEDDPVAADAGVTRLERSLILPLKAYQVLSDRNPAGFERVRKFVVAEDGSLLGGM